jgi:hypothetical protein
VTTTPSGSPEPTDGPGTRPWRDDTAILPTPVGPESGHVVHVPQPPAPAPPAAPATVSYASAYQPVPQYQRPEVGGGHVAVAWIVAVLTLGYMLPWAIAATRGRSNTLAIALVNLLVGWTFIGWVAALVMACLSEQRTVVAAQTFVQVNAPAAGGPPPPGWYPDGAGGHRYWDGRAWSVPQ